MPTYKLTYFNLRARAETARMLFKLAGVEFEDVRLTREEWADLKASAPMGQLPLLEVDGVTICQSNAINRFLARKFGFAGKTALDQARVDMIIDSIDYDMFPNVRPIFNEQDPEKKEELKKAFRTEKLEPMLERLEKLLIASDGGNDFFVWKEVTLADLTFFNTLGFFKQLSGANDILDKFPKLAALEERVANIPQIKAWIEERPQTDM